MRLSLLVISLVYLLVPAFAQAEPVREPITAKNVHQLQPIEQIDFSDSNCNFGTGWFVLSDNGEFIAGVDNYQHIYLWHNTGELLHHEMLPCQTMRDVSGLAFDDNHWLYSLHYMDDTLILTWQDLLDDVGDESVAVNLDVQVLDIWVDSNSGIWLDVYENNLETIINIPDVLIEPQTINQLEYAPAQDPDAIVRIGRIPPPYTVTSSREGIIKLWNIQTGQVVYEVDNGTGEAAVFGAINHAATHLIWRDSRNESLYLLNFETGENQLVAALGGEYAQWYFLSNDAGVAIAVNLGFEPNIVTWYTATGERTDIGEYRECGRPQPDMARLSADGTTLVIGCDTGLDIWRIVPESE